ncbi:hypothetical protein [Treponema pedis]|uniref:hypothetical protein n=1 Tax=Treponema pedis TaxID=409322 RepID=UPI0004022503|nr:hypothetical protein [Treponema pedis]
MKKNTFLTIFFIFAFFAVPVFPQENIYNNLLEYRYGNDPDFSLIKNNSEIAKNNYNSAKVNSLFAIELGTGKMSLTLTSDKEKAKFSMEPYALLGMPVYNNLALKITSPFSTVDNGQTSNKGFSLGLSADIYGQTRNKFKLQIEEAYENMKQAEKKLLIGKQLIEKKLLTDIQKMFTEYSLVLSKKLNTVQANIKYLQTVAQGFSENSAKLRTAKLSLMSSEREEKEAEFSFTVSLKIFSESCGIRLDESKTDDFLVKLASSIPKTKITSIENLSEENYSVILKAERDYKNALVRNKIELNTFTLSGEMGFSDMNIKTPLTEKNEKSVSTGLNMLLPGIKLSTGLLFPLSEKNSVKSEKEPSLQLSLAINPIAMYDYALKRKNTNLLNLNERIKLNEIKRNFENEFKSFKIQKEKFEWQQNLYSEELDVYKKNAEDHAQWFTRGVISSFENMQADIEYKKALMRYADANINVNIFNVNIKELFETGGK